jgi:Peptidase family S41
MRRVSAAVVGGLAALAAASAQAEAPTTPEGWRAAAGQDLTAIHDTLRDNSPAAITLRDGARFRGWLDEGLSEARAGLPKVVDVRSYLAVMRGYVGGFRDAHIQWGPTPEAGAPTTLVAWSGFVLGARGDGYEVVYRAPDAADAPPPHARLIGCDGMSADAFARTHDRYDGDFNLASGRYYGAVRLMLDRGNPFIARARSCDFRVGQRLTTYAINWRPIDAAQQSAVNAAIARPGAKLGLASWPEHGFWLTIPSMQSNQDWNGFYAAVQSNLSSLRRARTVVIDLRGDGGGDSGFAYRLANLLWGKALVDQHTPDLGPTVWRVTKLNRDYWSDAAARAAKDPQLSADDRAEMQSILERYDDALAHGQTTFELADDFSVGHQAAARNPMRGRIVLLTDEACSSACLDLMDLFTAMPGTVQVGNVTGADTIFMELTAVPRLPSGLSALYFGHKAWIKRPRGSNQPYAPAAKYTWNGERTDEAGLRAWLARVLGGG